MEDALVRDDWGKVYATPPVVLILVLMEDALVRCMAVRNSINREVLILVLMEDALVLYKRVCLGISLAVLILVLMEDALVLRLSISTNPILIRS